MLLLLLHLSSSPTWAAPAAPPEEVWLGHQVVEGHKPIPLLGDLETRTDSYVLARVVRSPDGLHLRQEACAMDVRETLGVAVSMSPEALRRLPAANLRFSIQPDGSVTAAPWTVAWGAEDLDRDGQPGVTIRVDSRMCGGDLYMASTSTSSASQVRLTADGLEGAIQVQLQQEILGASRACLQLGGAHQEEQQRGRFVYVRVPPSTTCADVPLQRWPARVP